MNQPKRPAWVVALIAACVLTLAALPLMVSVLPPDMGFFIILYPIYTIVCMTVAWKTYPERDDIFWIMIILQLSSFGLMWVPLLGV